VPVRKSVRLIHRRVIRLTVGHLVTPVAWSDSPDVQQLLFSDESQSAQLWKKAMNALAHKLGSHEMLLHKWDDALKFLSEVIAFKQSFDANPLLSESAPSHSVKQKRKEVPFKKSIMRHNRKKISESFARYKRRIQNSMTKRMIDWKFHSHTSTSVSKQINASRTIQSMNIPPTWNLFGKHYSLPPSSDDASSNASISCTENVPQPYLAQNRPLHQNDRSSSLLLSSPVSSMKGPNQNETDSLDHTIDSYLVEKLLNQRITEIERVQKYEQYQRDQRIEQDILKKEKEVEAANRAQALLRPLSDVEIRMVKEALYGEGNPQQILARYESDTIQRQSVWSLRPGKWLNDEVIHYFYVMLANRDALLASSSADSSMKRCHFFKSFFITKLLDEGVTNRYTYSNVKRWSKNVPGKDIFALDKIFIPVNMSNVHWACAVIYIQDRKIQFFDSMGGDGMYYMKALLQYLKDEWATKNNSQELPALSEWRLITCTADTPKQENGFDCGVFTCMFADFLSVGYPLTFTQDHITRCRERIALSILQGCAIR
jgi:sentrin-specific protease 1